ncbi:hypothetical protein CLI64_17650 [Nostoc sp. CENA543]|uniref:hypothetical protein n=1 Tax=Nostoc sp. CENA543 TaxID=1869241 RepID=UPI000CA29A03|nr:hypothetical protein [Nostoc sp. CENA543]AUT02062.1 hypothetical protein CLI64_17650 [Nostoc sp. CENA543]
MRNFRPGLYSGGAWFSALLAAIIATPVIAQTVPNFRTLKLAPGFSSTQGKTNGYTGGTFSLSAISNRDRDGKMCIGFADSNPDFIIELDKDFSRLQVLVNSGGKDTTLVIRGPNKTIRCGDDTGKSKDASIDDQQWPSGKYEVWVGAFEPGVKFNYTLSVKEK